jgi:hypothetical protein
MVKLNVRRTLAEHWRTLAEFAANWRKVDPPPHFMASNVVANLTITVYFDISLY